MSRRRLGGLRTAIDVVDDGLLVLLAARRRLVGRVARLKQAGGLASHDAQREARVQARAHRLARHLGVPQDTARAAMALAIGDARRLQGLAPDLGQGGAAPAAGIIAGDMHAADMHAATDHAARWLRLLPPPVRWAWLLRACPQGVQRHLLERAMARVLAAPLQAGTLAFLQDRRLGIDVTDLDLHWVVTLDGSTLRTIDAAAEASVRGTATDLLLLAGRLEDADTLFFQRRLELTGDVELGLTARNLLDRLPWERVPLGLRIALNRGARLAQAARAAHRAD